MTNPDATDTRPTPTRVRLPGVASTAIHGLLTGPGTRAEVMGSTSRTVWLRAHDQVIVISIGEGVRFPNGVHLPEGTGEGIWRGIDEGTQVLIGHGRIMIDHLSVTASRWWDPRPFLPSITIAELAANLNDLPGELPETDTAPLQRALRVRSAGGILHSARSLLGKGPGLTPEGDDLLIGAVAASRLLGEATGQERVVALVAGISVPLADLAEVRTSAFSAALLQMALRGQVVEPAAALLRALCGRGDVAASHLGLIRLGHTSGPAHAAGIVIGARALVDSR